MPLSCEYNLLYNEFYNIIKSVNVAYISYISSFTYMSITFDDRKIKNLTFRKKTPEKKRKNINHYTLPCH